jgi:hypothetical protein
MRVRGDIGDCQKMFPADSALRRGVGSCENPM